MYLNQCAWKYSEMMNLTEPAFADVHQYNLMHIRPSSSGCTIVAATDLVKERGVDNQHFKVLSERAFDSIVLQSEASQVVKKWS
ncbi:hypothetical protein Tco_0381956 [Tanacetum coccineum]